MLRKRPNGLVLMLFPLLMFALASAPALSIACDCGHWGDLDNDGMATPTDVLFLSNYLYLNSDARVQPPDCPVEAGDMNCDGQVHAADVVVLVQLLYYNNDQTCADPCSPGSPSPTPDPNNVDVITVGNVEVNDVSTDQLVSIPVYMNWDESDISAIVVPIWINSSDVTLDTVVHSGGFAASAHILGFTRNPSDANKGQIYAQNMFSEYAGNGNDQLFATIEATVLADAPSQCVIIDTAFSPPTAQLEVVNSSTQYWMPDFVAGHIDILGGCPEPPLDCGFWGSVNGDDEINPVDVVYIVNYVYKNLDCLVQPPNCPLNAGDINCDGQRNPVDVVCYVNRVYKGLDSFCANPTGE